MHVLFQVLNSTFFTCLFHTIALEDPLCWGSSLGSILSKSIETICVIMGSSEFVHKLLALLQNFARCFCIDFVIAFSNFLAPNQNRIGKGSRETWVEVYRLWSKCEDISAPSMLSAVIQTHALVLSGAANQCMLLALCSLQIQ
mmetsp:Transcript_19512/g.42268  ORF Transcript_19512/g.42268 Transcript_19512/m.42268 type:complete len:143 (-) Transcript_19512:2674-3102(-)